MAFPPSPLATPMHCLPIYGLQCNFLFLYILLNMLKLCDLCLKIKLTVTIKTKSCIAALPFSFLAFERTRMQQVGREDQVAIDWEEALMCIKELFTPSTENNEA